MTDYYPNWFDKNKFKKILAITDSNKFSHKNKIDEFKYTGIKDLVNNIKNNTISEISAKKDLNTLNKIKNAEIIKKRRYTSKQKESLSLFNDLWLDAVLTNKTLKSKTQKYDDSENENEKTLMSLKDENEKQNKVLNNDNSANAKNKKSSTNTKKATNKKRDENENMLL